MNFEIFECFEKHVDFDALSEARGVFMPQRYHIMRGGRGGGKSVFVARALVLEAYFWDAQILCARELMNSIADSSLALLWEQIEEMELDWFFTKTKTEITGQNGSRFFFRGLKTNITSIKSIARIDFCWCEEAEAVSEDSWAVLTPSIRTDDARVIITFNPRGIMDATYQRFVVRPPSDSTSTECLYLHNPHFPASLEQERKDMKVNDPDLYEWVWMGVPIGDTPLSVIPAKWLRACIDIHKSIPIPSSSHKQVGFDVSGGGSDPNAVATVSGNVLVALSEFRQLDPTSAAHDAFRVATECNANAFVYDCIGVGAGVGQTVAEANWNNTTEKGLGKGGVQVVGFNAAHGVESPYEVSKGGTKPAIEEYLNIKAQRWWDLRYRAQQSWLASQGKDYDAEYILSFDSDSIDADTMEKLIFECSTPQREYLGSKLRVEPKEKLLKRGVKSHNLADALIMALWPCGGDSLSNVLATRKNRRRNR